MNPLRRFLLLGVDTPDPDPDPTLDDLVDLTAADPTLPVEPQPTSAGTGEEGGEPPAVRELRARVAESERQLAAERAERAAERARATPAPVQPARDPEFEREEEELRRARAGGASEDQLSWLRWKVDRDRDSRNATNTAREALRRSQDYADQAEFSKLELTKPAIYKRYAERVNGAAAQFIQNGQPANRMLILRMLIGEDAMNGKIGPKPKSAAGTEPIPTQPRTGVDRGRLPSARSDVSGRGSGGKTEHQKRIERLKDVPI